MDEQMLFVEETKKGERFLNILDELRFTGTTIKDGHIEYVVCDPTLTTWFNFSQARSLLYLLDFAASNWIMG
jgi:hypothetical protein